MNDEPLIHFGIPGMKWGVRRNRGVRLVSRKTKKALVRNRLDQLKAERQKRRENEKRFMEHFLKYEIARFAKIDASSKSKTSKFIEKYISKDETLQQFLQDYHNKFEV
jgi:hypothetical protein